MRSNDRGISIFTLNFIYDLIEWLLCFDKMKFSIESEGHLFIPVYS